MQTLISRLGRERLLATLLVLSGSVAIALGPRVASEYMATVISGFGVGSVMLGLTVAVVNSYLGLSKRRTAVIPLLQLVAPAIVENHDQFLEAAANRFGKARLERIVEDYLKSGGDPLALSPEDRAAIYELVRSESAQYLKRAKALERSMDDLTSLIGWSFDAELLASALSCRASIVALKRTFKNIDAQAQNDVCEHFLDVELYAHQVFIGMARLGGISLTPKV